MTQPQSFLPKANVFIHEDKVMLVFDTENGAMSSEITTDQARVLALQLVELAGTLSRAATQIDENDDVEEADDDE